jgi:alpha-2-macroglobulin
VNDGDYLTLTSDRRTDALVLDALISNAPKNDLVEKVVAGLMASKTRGRWSNMQENTFALLAFKKYYDTYESVTPNFVAKAWIGDQFAGERAFKGRTTERSTISVPMKTLIEGGNRDLVVAKDGSGRLYYRIGLRYVPADLTLDALDRGFVVDRLYEGVDKKSDVLRDADGTWRIKAGAKVRVKLTLVAESQRTHVALIDPLPAGLEALNPDLAVTQPVTSSPDDAAARNRDWWWGNWYDFQQFRDDRSEAFSTFLPAGVYNYSYVARATTPGSFIVPPTRAEEMYAPETFGRTSTDKVVITSP